MRQVHKLLDPTHPFANITIASNNGNLSGKHDIGGTLDTIDKRLAAAIVVVKLGLGDRVVDVDGRNLEFALLEGLVQVMNTSGGLLRDTADIAEVLRELIVDQVGEITTIV